VFDFETSGLEFDAQIMGLSIKTVDACFHIPFLKVIEITDEKKKSYQQIPFWKAEEFEQIKYWLLLFFKRTGRANAFNTKFDVVRLMKLLGTEDISEIWHDCSIMAYALNPIKGGWAVEDFVRYFPSVCGYYVQRDKQLKERKNNYGAIDTMVNANYCNGDVETEWMITEGLSKKLNDNKSVLNMYQKYYTPLINIYARAEYRGIQVDKEYLTQLGDEMRPEQERLKKVFTDKYHIDPGSSMQLSKLMFGRVKDGGFGMKPIKTGKKYASTDKSVIDSLATLYATDPDKATFFNDLLEFRAFDHQYNTFVGCAYDKKKKGPTGLWQHIQSDGRIHPVANLGHAISGRNSYKEPNLQQFPKREKRWQKLKGSLISDIGRVWTEIDLSQAELRIIAAL
jgi:DNA polymerase-1